jgi:hypothetical protein
MAAYYTIVQYVPDPVTNERINIGVVVLSQGHVLSRFVQNWDRVADFGREDIRYLQSFAREVEGMSEQRLREIIGDWNHSIQFSPLAGSSLGGVELLDDAVGRYLQGYAAKEPSRPFGADLPSEN